MSVPTQQRAADSADQHEPRPPLFNDALPVEFERVPPQDREAESSALGGMMLSKDAIGEVVETKIKGSYYYLPAHETIHNTIIDLYGRGEPVDPITVAAALTKSGDITRIGGAAYLHTLVQSVPTAANAAYYAEIVVERAKLRCLVEAGTRIVQMGYAAEGEVDDILNAAAAEMHAVTTDAAANGLERVQWLDDMLEDYLRSMDEPEAESLPLPYSDLQQLLRMEPGDLVVIAARPAIGKSVVLLDIARHVAIKNGMTAMVSSMEMSRKQLMQRIISAEAKVFLHRVKTRQYEGDDRKKIEQAALRINGAPLVVDDGPAATLLQLRSRLRWLQGMDKLPAVLCVDYIQIMKAMEKKGQNRTGEVDALSRGLKELAAEFGIVIIAAAQLNREVEKRTDKTPVLADLRESGSIEADANAVVLLHRPDAYDKEDPRAGELDLIVAKNRQGPTATVTVAFQGHYARAMDLASGF
ncbi:replicative DNA helicase [Streptomyces syringium]|uniref:replicative DNA helicase n=1 Tax=Streptomyces syringium TaxID=76729 RepID=UPI003AAA6D12